jgi:hypothetical protein
MGRIHRVHAASFPGSANCRHSRRRLDFPFVYDLDNRYQVPGAQYLRSGRTYEQDGIDPHWRGIYDDKGRLLVAICHDMDLGDAWEYADWPEYDEKFSGLAFRIATNYVVYAMTH